jgi:hypothetical protein
VAILRPAPRTRTMRRMRDRFAFHPEPELIGVSDPVHARPALERLGSEAWRTALDYLYDEALRRAMGEPTDYAALRRT